MKGIKSKVRSSAVERVGNMYVQANTYNYAARAAAVVTNAERTSSITLSKLFMNSFHIFLRLDCCYIGSVLLTRFLKANKSNVTPVIETKMHFHESNTIAN